MRPPYTTPMSIGMESIPPDPGSGSNGPSTIPQAPPAVHSAPQLHQVLAEGGPRVGAPQATASVAELKPDGKKRTKPWWEELFNDDFLRTIGTITDAEISTEANFIEDSLGVAKGATVLDLACGTGRHAIELGRRGYQVIGFDLSLSMLARASDEAQERGQKLNFVQGDMREMTFEDAFDGIYCWQTSFGYFEEEKNAAVIGRVHRALRKGGQFLLDVVNRDYVAREAPSLVWFEGDGCICMDEMQMDFITSRLRVKRTMMIDDGRSKEIEYSVRAYSLHELGKMLHDAGFRVAEVTGKIQTPGVFFGCESPRIVILAEKR
jgi:SAM-dependent methyltransferase